MKSMKMLMLTMTTTLTFAACSSSTDALETLNNKINKAQEEENIIVDLNEKMKKAENEKSKKIKSLNEAKGQNYRDKAQSIVDDISKRQSLVEDEQKAMNKSQKIYTESKSEFKKVKDESQRKEAKELMNELENKYEAHDKVIEAYNKSSEKEKSLFSYLAQENATQDGADERAKALIEENKNTDKVVSDYQNQVKKVLKEKRDVEEYLDA